MRLSSYPALAAMSGQDRSNIQSQSTEPGFVAL